MLYIEAYVYLNETVLRVKTSLSLVSSMVDSQNISRTLECTPTFKSLRRRPENIWSLKKNSKNHSIYDVIRITSSQQRRNETNLQQNLLMGLI